MLSDGPDEVSARRSSLTSPRRASAWRRLRARRRLSL